MPLGKRTDLGNSKYSGIQIPFCCDLPETLKDAKNQGFDFVIVPLFHPRFKRSFSKRNDLSQIPITRSDLILTSSEWNVQVVGHVSPWINPDSKNEKLRKDSCEALEQEIEWAMYLGLQAIIMSIHLHCHQYTNTARIFQEILCRSLTNIAIWIQIPLKKTLNDANPNEIITDSYWERWHEIRRLCDYNSSLCLALELHSEMPSINEIKKYLGEPLKALIIPTHVYIGNNKGYPTLSKLQQEIVQMFMKYEIQMITYGCKLHKLNNTKNNNDVIEEHPSGDLKLYMDYLSYLFRKIPELTDIELCELNYRDRPQLPLEPLHDNLEAQTYEVFERDDTKYEKYGMAIYEALCDRPLSPNKDKPFIVMVVGAGRGPLVEATINASKESKRPVKIYAIEKNPNAIITLSNRIQDDRWGDDVVEVISCDMRTWDPPEKCDILISELLGSFGDNELSPECLDGAQRLLKEDGVSIPCNYTSYMAPISAHKIYYKAKISNNVENRDISGLERPYVVKLYNYALISKPKPIFHFYHPNKKNGRIDNSRYVHVTFDELEIESGCVMHGFAGYFETVLYKDVILSTVPERHTETMSSWFPMYFPIRNPIKLKHGNIIKLDIWRCLNAQKVWYEWCVTSPESTHIHNSNGKSYYISLY